MTMKRRHLLISLSTSVCALAYGFHKKKAVAQIAQAPLDNVLDFLGANLRCPSGNGLFVLYYGLIANPASLDQSLRRIIGKQPNFIIFADGNSEQRKRNDIPTYVHQNGGRAIMYVALGYGKNRADGVNGIDSKIDEAMNAGYDGIFFDETAVSSEIIHSWNAARATRMRSYDTTKVKLAIFNPGTAPPDKSIFNYADIVCVENNYNQKLPSFPNILPWHWLAVQGDPGCVKNNDGTISEDEKRKCEPNKAPASLQDAIDRTTTFRGNNGFWYYSSPQNPQDWTKPTHFELPSWYEDFANWIKSQPAVYCPITNLNVKP